MGHIFRLPSLKMVKEIAHLGTVVLRVTVVGERVQRYFLVLGGVY